MLGKIMTLKFGLLLILVLILAGCSSPTPTNTLLPPTVAIQSLPTQVVTLSNDTPVPTTPTPSSEVTAPDGPEVILKGDEFVNLRSGPGPRFPILLRADNGTSFVVLASSPTGNWLLLATPDIPGGQAWVYIEYTDFDLTAHSLLIATPPTVP
jgi:hypothetical protein